MYFLISKLEMKERVLYTEHMLKEHVLDMDSLKFVNVLYVSPESNAGLKTSVQIQVNIIIFSKCISLSSSYLKKKTILLPF